MLHVPAAGYPSSVGIRGRSHGDSLHKLKLGEVERTHMEYFTRVGMQIRRLWCLVLIWPACTSGAAVAAPIGFEVGMSVFGELYIANRSQSDIPISSILMDFSTSVQGDTFIDSLDDPPGVRSLSWIGQWLVGDGRAILPDATATDGQQRAILQFEGFEPSEAYRLTIDLDYLAQPDGTGGNLSNSTFTVTFEDAQRTSLSGLLSFQSREDRLARDIDDPLRRYEYFAEGTGDHAVSTVPLPASLWLFVSGLLLLAANLRRVREKGDQRH